MIMHNKRKNNKGKDEPACDKKVQEEDTHMGAELPDPEHEIDDAMRNDAPTDDSHTDNSGWEPATKN